MIGQQEIMDVHGLIQPKEVNADSDEYLLSRLKLLQDREGRTIHPDWAADNPKAFYAFKAWVLITCPVTLEGLEIDKDFLVYGNREYGPLTCVAISHFENSIINSRSYGEGDKLPGVEIKQDKGLVYVAGTEPTVRLTLDGVSEWYIDGVKYIVENKLDAGTNKRHHLWQGPLGITNIHSVEDSSWDQAIQSAWNESVKQKLCFEALRVSRVTSPSVSSEFLFGWWKRKIEEVSEKHRVSCPFPEVTYLSVCEYLTSLMRKDSNFFKFQKCLTELLWVKQNEPETVIIELKEFNKLRKANNLSRIKMA